MKSDRSNYHSFLLRLWRVNDYGDEWRATLQDVQSSELLGFPNLNALFQYLANLTLEHRIDQADWNEQADSKRPMES